MISYPLRLAAGKSARMTGSIVLMPFAVAAIGCVAAAFYVASLLERWRLTKSDRDQKRVAADSVLLAE